MATAADAERIRELRQETVAAIDQRARLAHRVRGELLRLVARGLICRDGAAQALQEWGSSRCRGCGRSWPTAGL
jgi:hypothetical protein